VPLGRPPAPVRPATPRGPRVQSSTAGVAAQARTYTDLLRDSHDAALFAHFCTSMLLRVPLAPGAAATPLGAGATPRLYSRVDPSPDGTFLIVEFLEPPFSYLVPCGRFPKRVELWRAADGGFVRTLAALPLAESIPIVNDSCRAGVRGVSWRADAPATLYWAEAQDGGDPRVAAEPRDIVYALDVAASGANAGADAGAAAPVELLRTAWRYGGISWGDGALALSYESQYKSRTSRTWAFAPDAVLRAAASSASPSPSAPMRLFQERSYEDAYSDPGAPVTRRTPDGSYVLAIIEPEGASSSSVSSAGGERPGRRLLFQGSGAGPEGNRPFMDLFDVDAAAPVTRLFECAGAQLEYPSAIVSDAGGAPITLAGLRMLLTRETPTDVPQYFIVSWDAGALAAGVSEVARPRREVQISDFPHPHPQLVAPPKQLIRYKRADGLDLSATLYTPPGWTAGVDAPLPCLVWCAHHTFCFSLILRCAFVPIISHMLTLRLFSCAVPACHRAYPKEFKTKEAAGQLRDSPHRFTSIAALSPLVWLARGYAVLDGPSLPICAPEGEPEGEPNDTYVEQLVAGAAAAVAEGVRLGVVDPRRVAVGGRSYGAFMTANLLAHAPHLFAAGVAQAGAYNRTLTPFGFQAEERTLWQAPDTYMKMSPFMHADRISKPLLLIHGEEDNNAGCFPLQSERFFAALKVRFALCALRFAFCVLRCVCGCVAHGAD
jgi:dipeptidyl aminopeptidase/acylaminoacyl peptidase